jgi:hypothetical protein
METAGASQRWLPPARTSSQPTIPGSPGRRRGLDLGQTDQTCSKGQLEFADVGVPGEDAEELQQERGGVDHPPTLQHRGSLEVVALEVGETDVEALAELLARLDLLGEQRHRVGAKPGHRLRQAPGPREGQVDLDDLDEPVEPLERRVELVVVQGQLEAGRCEATAALHHRVARLHGLQDLEDRPLARHELDGVAEQELSVDVDEAAVPAEDLLHAEAREDAEDDAGRRERRIADLRPVDRRGPKEELVRRHPLLTVKDRLPADEPLHPSLLAPRGGPAGGPSPE